MGQFRASKNTALKKSFIFFALFNSLVGFAFADNKSQSIEEKLEQIKVLDAQLESHSLSILDYWKVYWELAKETAELVEHNLKNSGINYEGKEKIYYIRTEGNQPLNRLSRGLYKRFRAKLVVAPDLNFNFAQGAVLRNFFGDTEMLSSLRLPINQRLQPTDSHEIGHLLLQKLFSKNPSMLNFELSSFAQDKTSEYPFPTPGYDYYCSGQEIYTFLLGARHAAILSKEQNNHLDEVRRSVSLGLQIARRSQHAFESAINQMQFLPELGFEFRGYQIEIFVPGTQKITFPVSGMATSILRSYFEKETADLWLSERTLFERIEKTVQENPALFDTSLVEAIKKNYLALEVHLEQTTSGKASIRLLKHDNSGGRKKLSSWRIELQWNEEFLKYLKTRRALELKMEEVHKLLKIPLLAQLRQRANYFKEIVAQLEPIEISAKSGEMEEVYQLSARFLRFLRETWTPEKDWDSSVSASFVQLDQSHPIRERYGTFTSPVPKFEELSENERLQFLVEIKNNPSTTRLEEWLKSYPKVDIKLTEEHALVLLNAANAVHKTRELEWMLRYVLGNQQYSSPEIAMKIAQLGKAFLSLYGTIVFPPGKEAAYMVKALVLAPDAETRTRLQMLVSPFSRVGRPETQTFCLELVRPDQITRIPEIWQEISNQFSSGNNEIKIKIARMIPEFNEISPEFYKTLVGYSSPIRRSSENLIRFSSDTLGIRTQLAREVLSALALRASQRNLSLELSAVEPKTLLKLRRLLPLGNRMASSIDEVMGPTPINCIIRNLVRPVF